MRRRPYCRPNADLPAVIRATPDALGNRARPGRDERSSRWHRGQEPGRIAIALGLLCERCFECAFAVFGVVDGRVAAGDEVLECVVGL